MTNVKDTKQKVSIGFTPARRHGNPVDEFPVLAQQRREFGPIDATLESRKTRENKRNAVMKNYFESKQLLSITKHLDTMRAVYFEKMKREQLRVGRSLWELEQRKRKIMRQIYDHSRGNTNDSRNPALFYFTQEKTRKRSRKHEVKATLARKDGSTL